MLSPRPPPAHAPTGVNRPLLHFPSFPRSSLSPSPSHPPRPAPASPSLASTAASAGLRLLEASLRRRVLGQRLAHRPAPPCPAPPPSLTPDLDARRRARATGGGAPFPAALGMRRNSRGWRHGASSRRRWLLLPATAPDPELDLGWTRLLFSFLCRDLCVKISRQATKQGLSSTRLNLAGLSNTEQNLISA
jgi:hypothetical protein